MKNLNFFFFISGCSSELTVFLFKVIAAIDAGKLLYGQQSTESYGKPKSIAVKVMFVGSTETVVNVFYNLFFKKVVCISCQRRPEKRPLMLVKKYEKNLTKE